MFFPFLRTWALLIDICKWVVQLPPRWRCQQSADIWYQRLEWHKAMRFWFAIRNPAGFFYFVSRCLLGHENIHDPYIISRKKLGSDIWAKSGFVWAWDFSLLPSLSLGSLIDPDSALKILKRIKPFRCHWMPRQKILKILMSIAVGSHIIPLRHKKDTFGRLDHDCHCNLWLGRWSVCLCPAWGS